MDNRKQKMNLSQNQQEVVNSTEKYAYVIAGAGSGKTRTLTEHIKLSISKLNRGEKILAVTFSNKAANELTERLLQNFSLDGLKKSVFTGTIHNFCMEIVIHRGMAIGLSPDLHIFETFEDRLEIFKNAIASIPQLKQKHLSSGNNNEKWIRESFNALSKAKRNLMFPSDYDQKPVSKSLYQEYQNLLLAQNAIDFDDILLYAYRILVEKESVLRIYQRIYKHICIDEAQDLNKAQYEIIKILAGSNTSIFMVGDPNQAIYGFNGSSSEYMCKKFYEEYHAKKYILKENFRSSRFVLEAAKKIEPSFNIEGQIPIDGEFFVKSFKDESMESAWVIATIDKLMENGHPDVEGGTVNLHRCAVLARNRYVFSVLETLLIDNNIEYTLRVSINQGLNSESNLFKIFDLGLRLIMNKMDWLHFSELLSILNLDDTKKRNIENFSALRNSTILEVNLRKAASETLKKSWDFLSQKNTAFRFDQVLTFFKQYCEKEANFDNDNERFLVYSDYKAWVERWGIYCKKTSIDERSLSNMMRSIALGITNIADDKGLILSTVHMAKGLEFDVVFIIGLNDGIFPDYRTLNNADQLNEERHNMFVSITRSKRLCYLTFPTERIMPWGGIKHQKPSRFLTDEWLKGKEYL
jgi:DNA helicase-2/ATP-dependent DNA helicase PcrA